MFQAGYLSLAYAGPPAPCAIMRLFTTAVKMNLDLPDFRAARVLVAGDLMLDRYWTGDAGRISPEAPVPVVRVRETHSRPGGAGNVAMNVAALGAKCGLLAGAGDDEYGARARVESHVLAAAGFGTITKLRVLSRHQQLIRLDFEADQAPRSAGVVDRLRGLLADYDVVVLSDYGKGTLNRAADIIAACRRAGKTVIVDPKGEDFRRYRGADFITPNWPEFQAVAGACRGDDEIHRRGTALARELELKGLLVTRGEAGISYIPAAGEPLHIAAEAREVFDVTGAGDTVIAVLAAATGAGAGAADAVRLANAAAGVAVTKLGAVAITAAELRAAVSGGGRGGAHNAKPGGGVMDEAALLAAVEQSRARGERIVMTNGCFDILHAGHTHYLNQAAALGDRLIVAVNTDDTVRRLKGRGRPINPLSQRMAVLASLAAVDWVAPFSEPTPERLICAVKPDLLVKGGDNDPAQVPGAECVEQSGGRVRALDYLKGRSTTAIINRAREQS